MFRISNNDFKILVKYKNFMHNLDNILENVPRKDMFYKDKLRDIEINLLNNIFICSYETNKEKLMNYYSLIKADIALIVFLLDRLHNKKYIGEKVLYKIGMDLVEINKMVTGWLNRSKIKWFKNYIWWRNKIEYLLDIKRVLKNNLYKDGKYNIFLVFKPKIRVVMSQSVYDKIINHYVARFILIPKLNKYLNDRNCATRKGMGTSYAIDLLKKI